MKRPLLYIVSIFIIAILALGAGIYFGINSSTGNDDTATDTNTEIVQEADEQNDETGEELDSLGESEEEDSGSAEVSQATNPALEQTGEIVEIIPSFSISIPSSWSQEVAVRENFTGGLPLYTLSLENSETSIDLLFEPLNANGCGGGSTGPYTYIRLPNQLKFFTFENGSYNFGFNPICDSDVRFDSNIAISDVNLDSDAFSGLGEELEIYDGAMPYVLRFVVEANDDSIGEVADIVGTITGFYEMGHQNAEQSYVNEFFPDFELNYPNTWDFETTTDESMYDNLRTRNITLEKQDSTLTISLTPQFVSGCAGEVASDYTTLDEVGTFTLFRSNENENMYEIASSIPNCPGDNSVTSNIDATFSDDFAQQQTSEGTVDYFLTITFDDNNDLIEEVLEIIAESSFE